MTLTSTRKLFHASLPLSTRITTTTNPNHSYSTLDSQNNKGIQTHKMNPIRNRSKLSRISMLRMNQMNQMVNNQHSILSKPLLQTLSVSKRRWDFELRHRMKPPKKPESTTRKAKFHIFDTRFEWSDLALNMMNRAREGTQSLVNIKRDHDMYNYPTASGTAVKMLYKAFQEPYSQHRSLVLFNKGIMRHLDITPFIAPSATIIGDVIIGQGAAVYYDAVIRADLNAVVIGGNTTIMDGAIITTDDRPTKTGRSTRVSIGNFCLVGQQAKLHGCRLSDHCVVGTNAILMEGVRMHPYSLVEPNSVVLPGQIIGGYEVWGGNPARKIRKMSLEEADELFDPVVEDHRMMGPIHEAEFAGPEPDIQHVNEALEVKRYLANQLPPPTEKPLHWNIWDILHNFKSRRVPEYYTWSYHYDPELNKDLPGEKIK